MAKSEKGGEGEVTVCDTKFLRLDQTRYAMLNPSLPTYRWWKDTYLTYISMYCQLKHI